MERKLRWHLLTVWRRLLSPSCSSTNILTLSALWCLYVRKLIVVCAQITHNDGYYSTRMQCCTSHAFYLTGDIYSRFVHNTSAVLAHVMIMWCIKKNLKICNDIRIARSRITNIIIFYYVHVRFFLHIHVLRSGEAASSMCKKKICYTSSLLTD